MFGIGFLAFASTAYMTAYMILKQGRKTEPIERRITKGAIKLANGTVYTGQWLNGKRDGYGKNVLLDGHTYESQWVKGMRQGFGKCKSASGKVYEGEWLKGLPHGHGTLSLPDGFLCEGNVHEGKR